MTRLEVNRQPAPWGSPPTPILPKWYFETLGSRPLPSSLQKIGTPSKKYQVLGDLESIWQHREVPLNKEEFSALVEFMYKNSTPPSNMSVVPAGSNIIKLLDLPLKVRTRNCIFRALYSKEISQAQEITVNDLLKLNNFGLTSLLDLMCIIEVALVNKYFDLPSVTATASGLEGNFQPPSSTTEKPLDPQKVLWNSTICLFEKLLLASSKIYNSKTFFEALDSNLGELAKSLVMVDRLEEITISDLVGELSISKKIIEAFRVTLKSLDSRDSIILKKRILCSEPLTLEEVGEEANVTRERIRQLETQVKSRLNHPSETGAAINCWISILTEDLRIQLGPIASRVEFEKYISATFPIETQSSDEDRVITEMARYLLIEDSDYTLKGEVFLSKNASEIVTVITEAAKSLADDVGIIDEYKLKAHLPDEVWELHWDQLIAQCSFGRVCGYLTLRNTQKALVKAALLSIGRPATKKEIGKLIGLDPDRISSQLSNISSISRADKTRWGLKDWIDDEYEGISAEIIQRINEDGGATRLERLLEELPRLFEVSQSSVHTYTKTPRFQINDGYVSLADTSSIKLRPLEDVIHGHTPDGRLFWSFTVEARYFEGYSLTDLPSEIAKALGCGPDERGVRVPISFPESCAPVSVSWPLTSPTGAYLGYLSAPLNLLNAQEGNQILLVLEGSGSIAFHHDSAELRHTPGADPSNSNDQVPDRAREMLERMKNRRRVL
ncbi:sigma factor-like helix-turn-helix DNA-binding protein [Candidatus Poriferisocius sp.]|uniref:sigma factor-like helix-turn-helix DNA-binding protein n=1 Tax=Candidatus Poriferisocius sp. TaxID=3101276 RepID=UPI003B01D694